MALDFDQLREVVAEPHGYVGPHNAVVRHDKRFNPTFQPGGTGVGPMTVNP